MKYEFIGWCKEANHDKVWGVIKLKDSATRNGELEFLTFWGRRGKKLQVKQLSASNYEMLRFVHKKQDKGYKSVDKTKLDDVYPGFETDLEKTAVWAALKLVF